MVFQLLQTYQEVKGWAVLFLQRQSSWHGFPTLLRFHQQEN